MKDTKAKIKSLLFLFCVINNGKTFLSAFRSRYRCQTALLKIIEDWKKALDDNKFVAAILMDIKNIIYKHFNNTGPKIDPCGTPLYIYLKLLHTFSTLIHCFLYIVVY
jgi:hypothetical protein